MNEELEKKVNKAISYFGDGYNCSQAVFMAYADTYGIEQETAAKLATSFGGGMGRLREVCGAVSGMFLVLGMHYPATDTKDKTAKTKKLRCCSTHRQRVQSRDGFIYLCRLAKNEAST